MLLNLRKRLARIRVFDPACGSGNFLVIAYKQMREIENTINVRRGELNKRSEIPITNFRGIELRDFSAEIARLALIIAEYQCDVQYLGQREALAEFLPLNAQNWITCGNALRLDWLSICPPTGTGVKMVAEDLFETPLDQAEIDFENEGGETYICGNPPYKGASEQNSLMKSDMDYICQKISNYKSLDYVSAWFIKATEYSSFVSTDFAFVTTNSICQGLHVPILWSEILKNIYGQKIKFAHTSFKWMNLASKNAGVTVIIVGVSKKESLCRLFISDSADNVIEKTCKTISPYLIPNFSVIVSSVTNPISLDVSPMNYGSKAADGKKLNITQEEASEIINFDYRSSKFILPYVSADDAINGKIRYCIWIDDADVNEALDILPIKKRIEEVKLFRLSSKKIATQKLATVPYAFAERRFVKNENVCVIPSVSSENREFLPFQLFSKNTVISNAAFGIYSPKMWNLSILASKLHLVWIATVCGKLETRYRYSNTLGWNTFPLPMLTEKNKADLTRCAEDILLAREVHFPATIADLYNPETMPENLRAAHERNDEVLERIYIGRRFRNDTERLEKLFDLYTKMTANKAPAKKATRGKK
jgi:hypothetical protein